MNKFLLCGSLVEMGEKAATEELEKRGSCLIPQKQLIAVPLAHKPKKSNDPKELKTGIGAWPWRRRAWASSSSSVATMSNT